MVARAQCNLGPKREQPRSVLKGQQNLCWEENGPKVRPICSQERWAQDEGQVRDNNQAQISSIL